MMSFVAASLGPEQANSNHDADADNLLNSGQHLFVPDRPLMILFVRAQLAALPAPSGPPTAPYAVGGPASGRAGCESQLR